MGLREAIATALDYGIEAIESSERHPPEIPLQLLAQARLAARAKVPLDAVLRRYFAGYTLLGDFVLEEAEKCGIGAGELKCRMRAQGAFLERLLGAVAQEYEREVAKRPRTVEERRAELVRRLLAGERIDTEELGYDFEGWHVGIAASGSEVQEATRGLGESAGARMLAVQTDPRTVWIWLGRRQKPDADMSALVNGLPANLVVGVGAQAAGLGGWCLTHRQALAAMAIAELGGPNPSIYGEVAMLASCAADELLTTSLRQLYLLPLGERPGESRVAEETLRAFFASQHSLTSAAAALGISRQAVTARLRTIESRLGRELQDCTVELEIALQLQQLTTFANV